MRIALYYLLFIVGGVVAQENCNSCNLETFTGTCRIFTEDGILLEERNYTDGKPSGIWSYFTADGEVLYTKDAVTGKRRFKDEVSHLPDGFESQGAWAPREKAEGIVYFPEKTAEYPGGQAALFKFIADSVVYPVMAVQRKIEGTVYVKAIVESTGELSNLEVMVSVDPLLDNEALRVIKMMPRWKPAMIGGEKVRSRVKIPIRFEIIKNE